MATLWASLGVLGAATSAPGQTVVLTGSPQADVIYVWKTTTGYRSYVKRGTAAPVVTDYATAAAFEILGGAGNDWISGRRPGDEAISGGAGAHLDIPLIAWGGSGFDVIHGGDGDDRLYGQAGADTLNGFGGNDTIHGGRDADAIRGGRDDDLLAGGADDDTVWGGPGRDVVFGDGPDEAGDDVLFGEGAADILFGGLGNDTLDVGSGATNFGRGGPDTLPPTAGSPVAITDRDTLTGGGGRDGLLGGADRDVLSAGAGDDLVRGGGGADEIFGGYGNDVLEGNAGRDYIFGGAQRDIIRGNEDCDLLDGGRDADRVDGDAGADQVFGGPGADQVKGGDQSDLVVGGPGGDAVQGGTHTGADGDECRDCIVDGCNLFTCESTPVGTLAAFGARGPVAVSYDPSGGVLSPTGALVDWMTDSGALSQHARDGWPCHDRVIGLALWFGETTLTGQDPEGRHVFADMGVELRGDAGGVPMAATLTALSLDPASGRFEGRLESVAVDTLFGSSLLARLKAAFDAGHTIRCSMLCADAADALSAATAGFSRPGVAYGPFTCVFDQTTGLNPVPEDCANEIDDDADGCQDCDDIDCRDDPACRESACDDAIDNDGDGRTDCDDDDCRGTSRCREQVCDDGVDNDGDGAADCLDEDCVFVAPCFEDCANGSDDNANGLSDCADPACAGVAANCIEADNCADGVDNDLNGLTDCDDRACTFEDACGDPEACCMSDGTCALLPRADCRAALGTPRGFGSICLGDADGDSVDDACEGACCHGDGTCTLTDEATCKTSGGAYHGNGTRCLGDGDGDAIDDACEGACCLAIGCSLETPAACVAAGGVYTGDGSRCVGDGNGNGFDDACDPEGACCLLADGCVPATETACAALGGGYLGDAVVCGGAASGDGYDNVCLGLPVDDCINARPIFEGTTAFSTVGVTTDGPDEPGACAKGGGTQIDSDIWYCYTAAASCEVTVSLCGSGFDTKLAVYDGCVCPATADRRIACNDDTCGLQSRVSFPASAGSTYLIRIGGHAGAQGGGAVTITCGSICGDAVCNGAEDNCNCPRDCAGACVPGLPDLIYIPESANPIIRTETYSESTCPVQEGCTVVGTRTLMRFTAEARNIGTADLVFGEPVDNPLFTFNSCQNRYVVEDFGRWRLIDGGGVLVEGHKSYFCLTDGFQHDPEANPDRVYTCANQGLQPGWSDVYGSGLPCQWVDITDVPPGVYTLEMEINPNRVVPELNYDNNVATLPVLIPGDGPPPNDRCSGAIAIGDGFMPFSNQGAATDFPSTPGTCDVTGGTNFDADIWYCYTAPQSCDVTVSLCGSPFDTKLAVYDTCNCLGIASRLIDCNDNACGVRSELTFPAESGNSYLLRIAGRNGAQGTGELLITTSACQSNDDCANAILVTEGDLAFSNEGATTDGPDQPNACVISGDTQVQSDVWYCYMSSCTGTATVSLCASTYDTKVAVYDGCRCPVGPENMIACDNDACGTQSEVTFDVTEGADYLIRIGGQQGAEGTGTLSIRCTDTRSVCGDAVCEADEDNCNCPEDCPGTCTILPDLVFNPDAAHPVIVPTTVGADDCAIDQGCVVAGDRKLLRFTTETRNIGTADLNMGTPSTNPLYRFDECRRKYVWDGFAAYRLIGEAGVVATGHKSAFCLLDTFQHDPPDPNANPTYHCGNQGISAGWADIYGAGLPCQWIDITDVVPGAYRLELEVNPLRQVRELNYDNNVAWLPVEIPCDKLPTLIKVCPGLGNDDPRDPADFDTFVWPKRTGAGLTRVDIELNEAVSLAGPETWCTTATGGATAPAVTGLVAGEGGVHTVEFDGPIPVGEWTIVKLTVVGFCDRPTPICFYLGHQPGDANQDHMTSLADANFFGMLFPDGPTKLSDFDGNGQTSLSDATVFGQIWHGTSGEGRNSDGTGGWGGTGLPALPTCACP